MARPGFSTRIFASRCGGAASAADAAISVPRVRRVSLFIFFSRSLHVQREVIDDERSLQLRVFGTDEIDLNRLSLVCADVERFLRIARVLVEIRIRSECG